VFESADWPASEFLLRFLLTSMLSLMTGEKTAAPAKIMALDLLGLMGAALSEATMRLRKACKSLENTESRLDERLFQTSESYFSGEPQESEIVALNGPYQIMLSYNEEQHQSESLFHSARRYLVVQWASRLCSMYDSDPESADIFTQGASAVNLFNTLRNIIGGNKAFEIGYFCLSIL
jgi:cohesin loading factor subunit SCC2